MTPNPNERGLNSEKVQTLLDCTKEVNGFLNTSSADILADMESIQKHAEKMAKSGEEMAQVAANTHDSIAQAKESSENVAASSQTVTNHIVTSVDMLASIREAVALGQSTIEAQKAVLAKNLALMDQLVSSVDDVCEKALEIRQFTNAIDQIALSTKVLSLNASIEAAKAGQFGKGFGVVAQEIKKFAGDSEDKAKQINQIANNINEAIRNAHSNIKASAEAFAYQEKKMEEMDAAFDKITDSVLQVDRKMQDVQSENMGLSQNIQNVQVQFEAISAISMQTAASSNDVSNTIQEQTHSIINTMLKIQELDNMTKELTVIIQDYEEN